jgi:sugar/nucleoside kinase (ribokinase family)
MKRILVLGGAHLDRRGHLSGDTIMGASNPGSWSEDVGGGGFNAARNLARLGHAVKMVAPRGGDDAGERVAAAVREAGVEDCPFVFLDRATPSYTAVLTHDGNLVVALADMELYRLFSPRRLQIRALRERFEEADLVLCDANLPAETLNAVAGRARLLGKPLAAIGISPAKIVRFAGCLEEIDFLFMNVAEAEALVGRRTDDPAEWPALLQQKGLTGGVVTQGAGSVVAFLRGQTLLLDPPAAEIVDVTGAGDALAAGFIDAMLELGDLSQALRIGTAAALLTLRSPYSVSSELSRMALQAELRRVGQPEVS